MMKMTINNNENEGNDMHDIMMMKMTNLWIKGMKGRLEGSWQSIKEIMRMKRWMKIWSLSLLILGILINIEKIR